MALLKTISESGSGVVKSLSRKRISSASESTVPMKRRCGQGEESVLESLPQELLVKIMCGVNHYALKQLLLVSKSCNETATIAKELHFFATPSKVVPVFRLSIITGELYSSEDEKAPNAPLRKARQSCTAEEKRKELADITVALFVSDSEDPEGDRSPRRKLFKS